MGLQWELHPFGVSSKRGPTAYGVLHPGRAVAVYLLPWFQGVSLDLKKKLPSATLVLAFLWGLSYPKEKKPTHQ